MNLKDLQQLQLPATADMHVHLRQDKLMELVVPEIRKGGVDTVFVMPNLQPPVTTVSQALEYKSQLEAIEPNVHYLMSLYLNPSITPAVIAEAVKAGITGVKMYPQGVTTNSDSGVMGDFISIYHDTFAAMQTHNMVLNLHGELPGHPSTTAEEAFLPQLKRLHEIFPSLRIVLEHCSTAAAISTVKSCGGSVAGTITAHHLYLTGDDSQVDPMAFCKPIPKTEGDRDALIKAVASGESKFFFGSDSAPHPLISKKGQPVPAGVFTQPVATQLVLLALEDAIEKRTIDESEVTQERLENFLSRSGRRFYRLNDAKNKIILERNNETIAESIKSKGGSLEVGISKASSPIFSLRWV